MFFANRRPLLEAAARHRLPAIWEWREFVEAGGLGGRVVAGSDTANLRPVPGVLLHQELALLVDSGLSPQEA